MSDTMICGWCGFENKDGWLMLTHRDTHRNDPRVIAGTAKVNAILANLPENRQENEGADA